MKSEVVISGMSGRFPEADNIEELYEKLFNKVDLVTESGRRWTPGLFGLPKRMGQLKDISKFDNLFFNVHHKSTHVLDPQARILLEVTYEAIVDAGYDPEELRERNIGVFIGNSISETYSLQYSCDLDKAEGYGLVGCNQALFSNRISYVFDFKGPSFTMDTACSSGAMALYQAVQAIRRGDCEAAIVGGANLLLRPENSIAFYRMKMLSDDGKSKSFDASGNGYVRSEAIAVLFIQKSECARRNYAEIVHIKTNTDGFKPQGLTYPASNMQERLMLDTLKESNIDPSEISYLEAHATGTPAGDTVEMSSISDVFCCNQTKPLLVGSLKSNIGHTEPSSGISSIIKILLQMERGLLLPNLHFKEPYPEIKPFVDGRIKVVTELTRWNGQYAAFNCFGFGGVNVCGILKSNTNTPNKKDEENKSIPQLVLYCGRTEESVRCAFDNTTLNQSPREYFALLHKIAYAPQKMKPHRGYKLLGVKENIEDIQLLPAEKRPVCFVFSGMGSQWPAMARDLMQIEIFAESIRKSAEILKPYIPDFEDMVTKNLPEFSTNENGNKRCITPSFISIAAIQIALVDVLNVLGVKPDVIVGHSVGELGCAYADGCFTAEQMLLASYWRGKCTDDADLIQGAMAAVGMTWNEAKKRCPKGVYPVCHNSEDSVTISGPRDTVRDFIGKLKAEKVFAREVNVCGYAYHCEYVSPISERLRLEMEKFIPNPKPRSSRWISSSYPEKEWNNPEAKLASASYYVHNLISPVFFCDALRHVPKNAIVIEIGPHHLLQAILKREIGSDAIHIGLMKRNSDNILHLLSNIGKMYVAGLDPDVEKLYPPVAFPVPRSTPMISPIIKWDHSETWTVYKWENEIVSAVTLHDVEPGTVNSEDRYLLDHCLDGRCIYPAAGYISLVWRTFAKLKFVDGETMMPIAFENVKFLRATLISETAKTRFRVYVSTTTGAFEISQGETTVCSGFVSSPIEKGEKCITSDLTVDKDSMPLTTKDIYKEFRLRGFDYGPSFQGVMASNISGSEGILKWDGNWVEYLDYIIHFTILSSDTRTLFLPIEIQKLTIDSKEHKILAEKALAEYGGIPVKYDIKTKELFSGGVYLKNIKSGIKQKKLSKQMPVLEEYKFIPYKESCSEDEIIQCKIYESMCLSLAKKILEASGKKIHHEWNSTNTAKINDDVRDAYLRSESENYTLLKCLSNVKNNYEEKKADYITECINNYANMIENDILCQTLLKESKLRTVIDVVTENMISKRLSIVEIAEGSHTISLRVHEYNPIPASCHIAYSVLHPKPNLLNNAHLPPNAEIKLWKKNSSLQFKDVDLFIMNYLKESGDEFRVILENATACLKSEGFILILVKSQLSPSEQILSTLGEVIIPTIEEKVLEQMFKEMNLNVICKKSDSMTSSLYLLRKPTTESYNDTILHIDTDNYAYWVDELREKFIQLQKTQDSINTERLWLVSQTSHHSGVIGLVKCLCQEPGGANIRCVFTFKKSNEIPEFSLTNPFYKEQLEKNLVFNVYKDGFWGSYRHIRCKEDSLKISTENAYLNILTIGDLSSFAWIHSSQSDSKSAENNAICHVYYAALNFRDVMIASGRVPLAAFPGILYLKDSVLGMEFSGRMPDGRRVMGLVSNKAMATTVNVSSLLLFDVPDNWSLEEAATVPTVYATAYYALIMRGNLQRGEKVLIHSGSGGVGQAAITIALSMGCEVYTTVGSEVKKEFLKKKFPQLKDENITNSRSTSFEQHILHATNGEGVDVVLNSLADDKLFASLNCLAVDGRFLEIGKYDLAKDSKLGMAIFLKNVQFNGILLDSLFDTKRDISKTSKLQSKLIQLVNNGIRDGVVQPLNTTVFNYHQAEEAFRYMASGKHIGKVLLKIREEGKGRNIDVSSLKINAIKRTTFDPQKSYIIIGGLGGFGLELCQWLIDRCAKNIVLTSRSGVTTGYQKYCIQRWEQNSINVVVTKLNAAKEDEAKDLLKLAAKISPIGAVFNLALVLRDGFMENQTVQNYTDVFEPKIKTTKNLDILTRKFCPDLDFFVCFSSIACGRGNLGQSNYGYANSVMERICEDRVNDGLPGLAVQWGPVGDVGIVHDRAGSNIVISGTAPQRIDSCLSVLDKFLQQHHPVVSSFIPYQPIEKSLKKHDDLMSRVGHIFGIKDFSSINPETNLAELGMDSLMGVEIKQFLEVNNDIVLSLPEIRKLRVKDLQQLATKGDLSNRVKVSKTKPDNAGYFLGKFDSSTSMDLIPTDTILHMNTITDGIPLFIIHALEGSVIALDTLAKLLPCPVYGIQYTPEAPRDSIENLARFYLKHLNSFKFPTHSINLAGWSFGTSVAFEMALQAEQNTILHPEIKNLIFLDGSPSLMLNAARNLSEKFDESLENIEDQIAALNIFSMMFQRNFHLDNNDLEKLNSFSERIRYTADKIAASSSNFNSADIETAYHLFASKIMMVIKYNFNCKLKKDVCLIKASEGLEAIKGLSDLYDLDKVCEGKIVVHTVKGNHYNFLQNDSAKEVSELMKQFLKL